MIDGHKWYNESNFVCLVLNNEECIVDGENTQTDFVRTPYYGFYINEGEEKGLVLINMNTMTNYYFVPD